MAQIDDPERVFARPRRPNSSLFFQQHAPMDINEWGHLLPASARKIAELVLKCHRVSPAFNRVPGDLVLARILPYVMDNESGYRDASERYARLRETEALLAAQTRASLSSPWWTRYRRAVVDSLHGLAEKCNLDLFVAHHAFRLIDLLWLLPHARGEAMRWGVRTMREHAAYLCVAALRISARLHQIPVPEDDVLACHIRDLFSKSSSSGDSRTCERYIDLHLGWRVLCITPLHCLQLFVDQYPLYPMPFCENFDRRGQLRLALTSDKCDRLYLSIKKWCAFFASFCLQHHEFSAIQPSLLASAVLYLARSNLKLSPPWKPELAAMTAHSEEAVVPVATQITDLYTTEFAEFLARGQRPAD